TERLHRAVDELLRHGGVGEVAPDPVHPVVAVARAQLFVRPLVLVVVARGRVADAVAVAEQPLGDREADAGVRAGDERRLHAASLPAGGCANQAVWCLAPAAGGCLTPLFANG